jgi:hypothetical protein
VLSARFVTFAEGRFVALGDSSFEVHGLGETGWSLQGVAPLGGSVFGFNPRLAALRGGVFAVEDARNRIKVYVDEGRYTWKALPVLDEALVGLEAHGAELDLFIGPYISSHPPDRHGLKLDFLRVGLIVIKQCAGQYLSTGATKVVVHRSTGARGSSLLTF